MYLDPTNDVAFRRIFGNENKKNILISFLNSVLQFKADKEIVDVKLLNTNQVPRIRELKETILDVRCTDHRDVSYIVEMQIAKPSQFEKRVLYYTSKAYSNPIEIGDDYPKLNQVIFIGIVNFNMFEGENYLSNHKILDEITYQNTFQDFRFCFIELPKFNLNESQLQTIEEKWIYFLKNAKDLKVIPKKIKDLNIIDAFSVLDKYGWSKDELELYDLMAVYRQDERGRIEEGYNQGVAKGINIGVEKGIEIGVEKGINIGVEKGIEIGIKQAQISEKQNFLIMILNSKASIDENDKCKISECQDIDKLGKAIEMILDNKISNEVLEILK